MTSRGSQTLTWDIDNRVTSVAISGGGTTLMEYDYTGTRIKKNAPTGISLFPFKGYEIDPGGVTTTRFMFMQCNETRARSGGNPLIHQNPLTFTPSTDSVKQPGTTDAENQYRPR
jgi:hypothetical protein